VGLRVNVPPDGMVAVRVAVRAAVGAVALGVGDLIGVFVGVTVALVSDEGVDPVAVSAGVRLNAPAGVTVPGLIVRVIGCVFVAWEEVAVKLFPVVCFGVAIPGVYDFCSPGVVRVAVGRSFCGIAVWVEKR